jgi:hypothetical protein
VFTFFAGAYANKNQVSIYMYTIQHIHVYRISSNKRPSLGNAPSSPYKAKKNDKWELIAFLLNNFFKKSDRKIYALVRLLVIPSGITLRIAYNLYWKRKANNISTILCSH